MDDFIGQNIVIHQVAPAFKEYLRNLIVYRYWSMLLAYPVIRANSDPKILTVDPLPDVMLQNISEAPLNNQNALLTDSYKSFLYYDQLRYRLLPYIYSLAGAAYHDNFTIMRGLAMDFSHAELREE